MASRLLLFLALLLGIGSPLMGRADLPAPIVLPNGMRVVLRERHTQPLIAIDLWVRAGAREEQPGEEGCAHFLEHTLFKGTTKRGPGEIDQAIESLGGVLNAATGPDYARFYTTVPSAHLEAALALLAEVVRHATLPAAEIERERAVILDELAVQDETARLTDALFAAAFPAHPYRRSPGGTPEAIRQRKRETLAAFYRRLYHPERCTLALVGDLTPERARAAVARAFGDWPRGRRGIRDSWTGIRDEEVATRPAAGARAATLRPLEEPVANPKPQIENPNSPFPTPTRIGLAFPAPPASEGILAAAARVAAALLGNGEGRGRLSAGMLAETDAAARCTPRQDPSLFLLTLSLTPDIEPELEAGNSITLTRIPTQMEAALLAAAQSLRTSPPGPAEFLAAKRRVLGELRYETETVAGLARAIGYADITSGDPPEALRARIERLTLTDLQRFVQTYLAMERRIVVHFPPVSTPSDGAR